MNSAGFSNKDYRAKDIEVEPDTQITPEPIQMVLQPEEESEVPEVNTDDLRQRIEQTMQEADTVPTETIESDELLSVALAQNEEYEEKVNATTETAIDLAPTEVRDKMNSFKINDAFVEEASALRFPQFMMEVGTSFFLDNEYIHLKLEHLEEGFTLKDKDVRIDFSTIDAEMARVDTDDSADAAPKVWQIKGTDSTYYKEWFNAQPSSVRLTHCKGLIKSRISKLNCINDKKLQDYINRVVDTMTED